MMRKRKIHGDAHALMLDADSLTERVPFEEATVECDHVKQHQESCKLECKIALKCVKARGLGDKIKLSRLSINLQETSGVRTCHSSCSPTNDISN